MNGRRGLLVWTFPAVVFLIGLVGRGMLQPSETRTLVQPLEELPDRFGSFVATGDHVTFIAADKLPQPFEPGLL